MLMPDNIKPENSIYYNGGLVLQVLLKKVRANIFDLYYEVQKIRKMSFPVFVLSIDWLYLIDAAFVKDEEVILCS